MSGAARPVEPSPLPAPALARRRKVVLCGGFGRGHVGDEAFLHAQHRLLAGDFDLVALVDPVKAHADFRNWWPYPACEIHPLDGFEALLREPDIYALHVGGSSLPLSTAAFFLMAAKEAGKRTLLTGTDIDLGAAPQAGQVSRGVLEGLDLLSVRFRRHHDRLNAEGVPAHAGADWALGLPDAAVPARALDVVLTIRGHEGMDEPLDAYRKLIAEVEAAGRQVTPVPFAPADMHLFNRIGIPDDAQEIHWHDPRTVQALIGRASLVVSIGRMHPLILALKAGRPCLAVDADSEHPAAAAANRALRLFCRDFGVPCYGSTAVARAAEVDPATAAEEGLHFPESYLRQYDDMALQVRATLERPEIKQARPRWPLKAAFSEARANGGPRKIYHLHVAKCGGTAVNVWLDLNVHAERARPPAFMFQRYGVQWAGPWFYADLAPEERQRLGDGLQAGASDSIAWFDVLHGHVDISHVLDESAYVFSILRNPRERALSQFRDYRRLVPQDYAHKSGGAFAVHEACRATDSLAEVMARCGESRFFRFVFEDMECRALTQGRIPFPVFQAMSPQARAEAALGVIESRCTRIGLQESMGGLLNGIAADLGWAPVGGLGEYNVTEKSGAVGEADLAAADSLTPGDRILYETVAARLAAEDAEAAYGTAEFERFAAAERVRALSPMRIGAERVFDMNMPVIGSGVHGRDAANTRECCSWIGPDNRGVLYFPVPGPGVRVLVRLYVRGWVHDSVRAEAAFLVDGERVPREQERRIEVDEVVCLPAVTRGSWMKVEITAPRTMTDAEAGRPGGDRRRKLLNLWRYSYEPVGSA